MFAAHYYYTISTAIGSNLSTHLRGGRSTLYIRGRFIFGPPLENPTSVGLSITFYIHTHNAIVESREAAKQLSLLVISRSVSGWGPTLRFKLCAWLLVPPSPRLEMELPPTICCSSALLPALVPDDSSTTKTNLLQDVHRRPTASPA